MPPKKKASAGKKSAKARQPGPEDEQPKEKMSKEQLAERVVCLRKEIDEERKERNYSQLERDRIYTFWENAERQLQELKVEYTNLEKDIEEEEWRHHVGIKEIKQRMKQLLCEHQTTTSQLKEDGFVSTDVRQKEQEQLEKELHKEMRAIIEDMQKINNEGLFKELARNHDEEIDQTRNSLEKELTDMNTTYKTQMKFLQQELDNMRKNELCVREDYFNGHIASLIEDYNIALREANELVTGIQLAMEVNNSLKATINEKRTKLKEKDLFPVFHNNKCLTEILMRVKEDNAKIERKIKYTVMNKDAYGKVKEKKLNHLKQNYQVLEQKFSELQLERDELYKTYSLSIKKVQNKPGLKSGLLELKLKALTDSLEKTHAHLHSVLSASNMDQKALCGVTKKIEENLDALNISIKNLQYKKAWISKARKDLLLTYEAKLRAFGVPVDEGHAKSSESMLTGKSPSWDSDPVCAISESRNHTVQ